MRACHSGRVHIVPVGICTVYNADVEGKADNPTRSPDDAPKSRDTQRSVTMTSDSGVAKQYSDYARQIQETLDERQHMQETSRLVTSPDEREALEREIRQRTDLLGSLLVGNRCPF